jgi:ribosomal protein S18 acetylase RimI-like enzyme
VTLCDVRAAKAGDLAGLDRALRLLSWEIGDPHPAEMKALSRALFETPQSAWAHVAEGAQGLSGLVLFSPVFSTARGGAGVYVSDLWVDSATRGQGIGTALLRCAAKQAFELWGAIFMRLAVHDGNARAAQLYRGQGFATVRGETLMLLSGEAFQRMRRRQ